MAKPSRNRSNRIGRNDPCFCGSGLKFKKCCITKQLKATRLTGPPPPEVLAAMRAKEIEVDRQKAELESHGIYISLLNTIGFKGKRGMVISSQILFDGNENSTFHELILRELERTLGEDWWKQESAKPTEE